MTVAKEKDALGFDFHRIKLRRVPGDLTRPETLQRYRRQYATSSTKIDEPIWIWSPGARMASSTAAPFTYT